MCEQWHVSWIITFVSPLNAWKQKKKGGKCVAGFRVYAESKPTQSFHLGSVWIELIVAETENTVAK